MPFGNRNSRRGWLLGLAVLGLCQTVVVASAQAQNVPKRASKTPGDSITVSLALAERIDRPGARALIVRHNGNSARNAILVSSTTTAVDLANAADMFVKMRAGYGDEFSAELRKFVMPTRNPSALDAMAIVQAQRMLQAVRAAPVGNVPGVGHVRNVDWRLPPGM